MIKARTEKRHRICDAFNRHKKICIANYLPIEEEWVAQKEGFRLFYDYILKKYNKAEKKWRNYTKVSTYIPRKRGQQYPINITFKVREKGLVKRNILITGPTELPKQRTNTHKIMFEDRLLSTRDIQQILKKRGINISMCGIARRLNEHKKIMAIRDKEKIFYQGRYVSSCEIERINNIHIGTLKGYLRRHTLEEAKIFYNLK